MPTWKRIFLKAAGFGVGITLALAVLASGLYWYSTRPKPPKPWNTKAIRATYYNVTTSGSGAGLKIDFGYILENTTDRDYSLDEFPKPHIAVKLEDTQSLAELNDENLKLRLPIYIPAHQKVRIYVEVPPYGLTTEFPGNAASEGDLEKFHLLVAQHVSQHMENLGGFEIFDESTRYQIDLPGGWKQYVESETKKEAAKQSPPPSSK